MKWVFILGGSSGFGLASAKLFAERGYNVFIVHRDSKSNMSEVKISFQQILDRGVKLVSMNINANTKEGRKEILFKLENTLKKSDKISVFLHTLADGNIKPLIKSKSKKQPIDLLSEEDLGHTIYAMGTSFIFWSRHLFENGFFSTRSRIIGISSEGSQKVIPGYAAVGAAKSVLETGCRYLASELAPYGITTNLINAGITDTPALRAIPHYKKIMDNAISRNPFKRLTQPEDVAKVVFLLSAEEADWINGETIRVDGGEQIIM